MIADIVARLRAETENKLNMHGLMLEAANEIVRLREGKTRIVKIRPLVETGPITISDCINTVAAESRVARSAITGECRGTAISYPRMVAAYLARRITAKGYIQIGRALNRDHTSVIHSVRRVPILMEKIPEIRSLVERCEASLTK